MANGKRIELDLPKLDDLFTTQEIRDEESGEKVVKVDIDKIDSFPNHPFKVRDDEEMFKMVGSIKEYGVLSPAIMRPKEDGRLEMVAGHRRMRASVLAGIDEIPAIVRNMSDDEATILMVDSNLQREKILPSEKAAAYKMKLDAMKRQGKRTDLTSVPVAQKSMTSREILGEQVGESQDNIRRYIRLNELIPELLEMVDENKIALRPAVEISYLPEELQYSLLENIDMEQCTPSHAQALKMKKMYAEGKLDDNVISSIMQEEKPNQKDKFTLSAERVGKLLPKDLKPSKREAYILEALDYYGKYRKRQKERDMER